MELEEEMEILIPTVANLTLSAYDAIREGHEKYKDAGHWRDGEPRYHIFKACDELFQARDHAQNGEVNDTEYHFGKAIGHMALAMDTVEHRNIQEDT